MSCQKHAPGAKGNRFAIHIELTHTARYEFIDRLFAEFKGFSTQHSDQFCFHYDCPGIKMLRLQKSKCWSKG